MFEILLSLTSAPWGLKTYASARGKNNNNELKVWQEDISQDERRRGMERAALCQLHPVGTQWQWHL